MPWHNYAFTLLTKTHMIMQGTTAGYITGKTAQRATGTMNLHCGKWFESH